MRELNESRLAVNGVELQIYDWPGDGPAIFLAHATGFHARCWDQVVERLPGRHVVAIDMRGHGRSEKPAPPYPWPKFGEDVAAIARELGLRDAIGAGHSKGGFAVAWAAGVLPGAFDRLLLIDPVIMTPETYRGRQEAGPEGEGGHFAARRRNEWASPAEMFERFRGREPFSRWDERVLRDYCDYGLISNPDGEGYVLACPPAIEAAVYAGGSAGGRIHDLIPAIDVPVRVLRARPRAESAAMDMSGSPTDPGLAARFAFGEDVSLPQYSHFIPMEDPAFVAAEILALAER